MPLTLLRRKLTPPPLWSGALRRERLHAVLDAAIAAGEHIALVAGSGFGKTSLLADWAASRTLAWVGLDAEDADMDAFLGYTIAAFEAALPGFRTEASRTLGRAREREGAMATLGALLADLDEQVDRPLVLVLDDYHLAASPSLDALLARMLKYLPPAVRLVLASRQEPAADLAALRSRRQLRLLGSSELAFDMDELVALRPELTAEAIATLLEATDGWPAAMGMTPELLDAYVNEQVLRDLDPDARRFLSRAALLDAFDAAACEAALGLACEAPMRDALLRAHVIAPVGERGYAVTQPLRGLLRRRFARDWPAEERRAIWRRIGDAHWQAGQEATALRVWCEADEQVWAAERLEAVSEAWLAAGRLEALHAAIAMLGRLAERPGLALADGEVARRWGDFARAGACLERALAGFESTGDAAGAARARLRTATIAASRGQPQEAREALACARAAGALDDRFEPDARNLEGGLALFAGQPAEAIAHFEASLHGAKRLGDAYAAARAIHNLGVCYTRLGEFRRSLECYDAALAATGADETPAVWMTPINRALVLAHLGRPVEALAVAERALDLVRRYGLKREETYALRTLGHAHRQLGHAADAAICFESAELLARRANDPLGIAYSLNFQAELAASCGRAEDAVRLVAEIETLLGGSAATQGLPEFAHVRAKVALAAGRTAEAAELLTRLREEAHGPAHRHLLDELEALLAAPAPWPRGTQALGGVMPDAAHEAPARLEVDCFRGLRVRRPTGEPVNERDWQSARAKLLLAYLLHVPEGTTKARLFEVLYPNEATTDASLNMNLMRLRKALEPGLEKGQPSRYVLRADGRYAFNRQAHLTVDTQAFEHAMRQALAEDEAPALEAALTLYRGEFLPEFDNEWVIGMRQHYRDRALEACRRLLTLAERDRSVQAVGVIKRALEIDSLSEEFHREMILHLLEAGEPYRALEHFRLCERRFQEQLGLPPPEDLAELVGA